jgi:hypothetical protein
MKEITLPTKAIGKTAGNSQYVHFVHRKGRIRTFNRKETINRRIASNIRSLAGATAGMAAIAGMRMHGSIGFCQQKQIPSSNRNNSISRNARTNQDTSNYIYPSKSTDRSNAGNSRGATQQQQGHHLQRGRPMVLYQRMTENISFTSGLDCRLQMNSFVEVRQLPSPAKWTSPSSSFEPGLWPRDLKC